MAGSMGDGMQSAVASAAAPSEVARDDAYVWVRVRLHEDGAAACMHEDGAAACMHVGEEKWDALRDAPDVTDADDGEDDDDEAAAAAAAAAADDDDDDDDDELICVLIAPSAEEIWNGRT